MKPASQVPSYVLEHNEPFLQLWPHRYDYLWAQHPAPGEKPQWYTESRHPLSDRLILQNSYLYGVRFGPTTRYVMLDIDQNSPYHPAHDPLAIPRIREALEDLGLVSALICRSSYSGGLHLYFPFEVPQKTWQIARAVATVLDNYGFQQIPGHLELYPNPKPAAAQNEKSLYRGHRLPLQAGSYLLNEDYLPVSNAQSFFVKRWYWSQAKNDLDQSTLQRILKVAQRRSYRVTYRAEKFLNDLNAEIERGWTGPGMTNRLLGRITLRSYIFGHVLQGTSPLCGEALVQDIVRTAQQLPGFYEWSNHVHELDKKARDWARSIQQTERYFPYGTAKGTASMSTSKDSESSNVRSYQAERAANARQRIQSAIAALLNEGHLPAQITERFQILTSRFHFSGATLYKHKDLWHPHHLSDPVPDPDPLSDQSSGQSPDQKPVENPPTPPNFTLNSGMGRDQGAPIPECQTSLLSSKSCNCPADAPLRDSQLYVAETELCNAEDHGGEGQRLRSHIQQAIASAHASRQAAAATRYARLVEAQQQRAAAVQKAYAERMVQYLESGDPILMAEALQWLQANDGPNHGRADASVC